MSCINGAQIQLVLLRKVLMSDWFVDAKISPTREAVDGSA